MSPTEKRSVQSSMEPCPACDTPVLVPPGESTVLRCDACGMRFSPPRAKRDVAAWNARDDDGLGIHPALAKRYKAVPQPPMNDGNLRGASLPPSIEPTPIVAREGDEEESRTEPGKPAKEQNRTAVEMPKSGISSLPSAEAIVDASDLEAKPEYLSSPAVGNETPVERRKKERPSPLEGGFPELPGFEIVSLVGQGAMGRVFKARERSSGRVAALKLLSPELAARADFVARFEREAAAMERVQHPGVVRIVGNSSHGNLHYLWMDFVDGGSLRRILDQGRLTPARALKFARQIIQGLGAAHDVGVIHRDLKPENILVAPGDPTVGQERLVLVDFGLAGITDENEDPHPNLTKSRMTMGTVNYMAPEQRTNAKHVDARADLYATGVILYELLMGDLPLGRFALPTERGLPLPPSIDDVVVKSLARAPEERYQSAAEFDRALAEIETAVGFTAGLDTWVGEDSGVGEVTSKPDTVNGSAANQAGGIDDLPPGARANVPVSAGVLSTQHPPTSAGAGRDVVGYAEPFRGEMQLLPAANPSDASAAEDNPWASVTGSFTHVPWFRRTELLWGVLVFVIGAVAGLWFTPGGSSDAAHAVRAPAPQGIPTERGGMEARLAAEGAHVMWNSSSAGFDWENGAVHFRPPPEHVGPALLRAETTMQADPLEFRGRVELTQATGADGWGGIVLSDENGKQGVGAAIRSDGSCAVLFLDQGRTRAERVPCKLKGAAANLAVQCHTGRCRLSFDGDVAPGVYSMPDSLSAFVLGCAGTTCRFGSAR